MQQIAATSGPTNIGLLSVGPTAPSGSSLTKAVSEHRLVRPRGSTPGPESRRADSPPAKNPRVRWRSRQAKKRLAKASLTAADIDGVIVAPAPISCRPAVRPCGRRGAGRHGISAFDIGAGCAGFGMALGVAADMIRGGSAAKMLVIGTEKLSPTVTCSTAPTASSSPTAPPQSWWVRRRCRASDPRWRVATANRSAPSAKTSTGSTTWTSDRHAPVSSARGQRGLPLGGVRDGQSRPAGDGRGGSQTR